MKRIIDYSVYLVTDRNLMSSQTIEEAVEKAIIGGVTLVQLREKNIESLDFYNEALRVKSVCDKYGVPLIINDRFDIALAVDADGVHIGQSDIPAKAARKLLGKDKILGVSATNLYEAKQAFKDGADYLGVGAMFATGTKTDAQIVTKEQLQEIADKVDLPIVIIGGINEKTIPQFSDISIDGVAVVSAIIAKQDISQAARQIKKLFFGGRRRIVRGIKGAIFDLDGTILDSMDVWKEIDYEFLNKRGFAVPDNYINEICARSFTEAAEYTIKQFSLPDSVDSLMLEWQKMAIEQYSCKVKLLPFTLDYLHSLKQSGIKLGVATGLSKTLYEPCLKANGIFDLFDMICSVDEVAKGKESPDIFEYAIRKLALEPCECIIFEDILPAIKSAKQTGASVYGVHEKYSHHHSETIKKIADGYIDDFSGAPIIKR